MIWRWSLPVVSLLPSATEIVCALGAGPELVGVWHECDQPAKVAEPAQAAFEVAR
jgi:ABC-type hemin transport system substrate-binding protein